MKIEIGESLGYSYLRHVKKCWLVQHNWKTSEHWSRQKTDVELDEIFHSMRRKFDTKGSVFKKTKDAAKFLKQGEIDIVGVDQKGCIHAMEIAFHEAGLNYGGGADNRVLKKMLRTLMILRAYFPSDARVSIYFVSPKVNPGVQEPLNDVFNALCAEYPEVEWRLVTNRNFAEQMMRPTLEKAGAVADTSELFVRAAKLLELTGIQPSKEAPQARTARPVQKTERAIKNVSAQSDSAMKLQPLVQDLMNALLVRYPALLDETDKRNLMDSDYCNHVLGLQIANHPLLRKIADGRRVSGHDRYYKDQYGGFYVCSQWWKNYHVDNAKRLLIFVTRLADRKAGEPNAPQLEKYKKIFQDYIDRMSALQGR